jgi:hypothetical protein
MKETITSAEFLIEHGNWENFDACDKCSDFPCACDPNAEPEPDYCDYCYPKLCHCDIDYESYRDSQL